MNSKELIKQSKISYERHWGTPYGPDPMRDTPELYFIFGLLCYYDSRRVIIQDPEKFNLPEFTSCYKFFHSKELYQKSQRPNIAFYIAKVLNWDLARECTNKYLGY